MKFSWSMFSDGWSIFRWYKKPAYRDIKEYSEALKTGQDEVINRRSCEVPSTLGLDRILHNQTCTPMSLHDFYMYLKHIERSAENLEFYVWFTQYEKSYPRNGPSGGISVNEKSDSGSDSAGSICRADTTLNIFDQAPVVEEGCETLQQIISMINPVSKCSANYTFKEETRFNTIVKSFKTTCGMHSSSTCEPLLNGDPDRETEIKNVISLYLADDAPYMLNISTTMRDACLEKLKHSIHPDVFRPIAQHCYGIMKGCSHRNFIRLGVNNGSMETLCIAMFLGIVGISAGVLAFCFLGFYPHMRSHSQGMAFVPWPLWTFGITLVIAGIRGSCFFLLLFRRRQLLPWEALFISQEDLTPSSWVMHHIKKIMIFDTKVKIKERGLRDLQLKIVFQSVAAALVISSVACLVLFYAPFWMDQKYVYPGIH